MHGLCQRRQGSAVAEVFREVTVLLDAGDFHEATGVMLNAGDFQEVTG